MIMILCLLVHANCVSPYLVIPTSILSVCLFVRISWTGSVLASINNDNLYRIHSSIVLKLASYYHYSRPNFPLNSEPEHTREAKLAL